MSEQGQNRSTILRIVKNVYEAFIPYRNAKLIGEPLDKAAINDAIRSEYIRISATIPPISERRAFLIIIILALEQTQRGIKKKIENAIEAKTSRDAEVMAQLNVQLGESDVDYLIIADAATLQKTRVINLFGILNKKARDEARTHTVRYFPVYDSSILYILPKTPCIPHHEIMPEEESKALLEMIHKTKSHLPQIKDNDPPIIWAGGRPGQIVKIYRHSENSIITPIYRLIVKAPFGKSKAAEDVDDEDDE